MVNYFVMIDACEVYESGVERCLREDTEAFQPRSVGTEVGAATVQFQEQVRVRVKCC